MTDSMKPVNVDVARRYVPRPTRTLPPLFSAGYVPAPKLAPR